MSALWMPREMAEAPKLDRGVEAVGVGRRSALLVNPFYRKDPRGSFGKHVLTPSLALTSVAGATPADWEVSFWDENLLQGAPPVDPVPEVVGITVQVTAASRAYELAAHYRAIGAKVILGGPHMTACSGEAAAHADAVCIGDGVEMWPKILRDVEAGTLRKVYRGEYRRPYDLDPAPRRDILPRASFLTTLSVIATRGCSNRCDFCYLSTRGVAMRRQAREVRHVVAEFEASGEPYGVFIDNNLGADREYLRELCLALRGVGKIWSAAVCLDVTDDPELVRLMAQAGCAGVFVGLETLCDENLRQAHKRCPGTSEYARRVGIFHDNGTEVNGSFVFGFDHDRKDVFERTIDWIEETRLACATFHVLTPYPGTPLFRRMEAEGRLLHRDWDRYDTATAVFRPKHMTPEELEAGYAYCYRRLFSLGSIWQRRPRHVGELLPYLAMTLLYKKSNRLWHVLIRRRLTATVWRPLMRAAARRHVARREALRAPARVGAPISAGV